ncbi:MAG TPA: restriction endonuclease [Thermoplasmatales archaeon]|nr:restriction endonuclease [Thermoplasmatales archaeon]
MKEEFERSIGKLKPLIERIEKTDWLIDQVVYRLYGLSEEEIRVVEG